MACVLFLWAGDGGFDASRPGEPARTASSEPIVETTIEPANEAIASVVDEEAAATPLLLVYGFQPLPGFHPLDLWADAIRALDGRTTAFCKRHTLRFDHGIYALPPRESRRPIYVSDYALAFEPTIRDLRFYAHRLAEEIVWVREREGADRVDVIAFSMGALVARSYIEAADFESVLGDPDFEDFGTAYRNDVRTLITIAAPHHGAAFAALGPWFGPLPQQLDPDSQFFRLLNAGEETGDALHPDVRYVSLAGQSCLGFGCSVRSDVEECLRACVDEALHWSGHDLVTLMASARLEGAEHIACVGFDHSEMRTHAAITGVLESLLEGEPVPDALFSSPELESASGL